MLHSAASTLLRRSLPRFRAAAALSTSSTGTSTLAIDVSAWLDARGVKLANARAQALDDAAGGGGRLGFTTATAARAGDTLATLPRSAIFCAATANEALQNPLSTVCREVISGYGALREAEKGGGPERFDAMELALLLVAERRMPGHASAWGAWLDAAEAAARSQPEGHWNASSDRFFVKFAASLEDDLEPVFDPLLAFGPATESFFDALATWYSYATWRGKRLPAAPGALEEVGLGLSLLPLSLGGGGVVDGARNAELRLLDEGEQIETGGGFLAVEAKEAIAAGGEILM